MTVTTSNSQAEHQQVQLLLPWYINQSLQPHERLIVEAHIRHCLLCRRELVGLHKLANAITQTSDLDAAAETSFAGLAGKLPAREPNPLSSGAFKQQTPRHRLSSYVKHSGFRYAMAASLLLALLLPFGWRTLPIPNEGFRTLSAARPGSSQDPELRVVFAKSSSEADIAGVLAALHGQRVGEVNSAGALTVRLNSNDGKPSLEQAIAILRSRPDVLLAEPVLQP
ncbi:zf-HC2 domain-containing protein [Methylomonas sp. 2BW1-5-20]|uniref:zf-HC2 domain-containing protein n=1 Tax=Methylomonas sp. 2BW1-5-20 TaxID=3376686 RepID=UPI004051BB73